MSDDQVIVHINTIDELDEFFHQQVIDRMKAEESGEDAPQKLVKVVLGEDLQKIGIENLTAMMLMKCVDRVLNHPDVLGLKGNTNVHESATYENTILPLLCDDENVTYH